MAGSTRIHPPEGSLPPSALASDATRIVALSGGANSITRLGCSSRTTRKNSRAHRRELLMVNGYTSVYCLCLSGPMEAWPRPCANDSAVHPRMPRSLEASPGASLLAFKESRMNFLALSISFCLGQNLISGS